MIMDLFLYISIIAFIISHIFLFVQGIINNKFYRFNDRKIIVERTLFEQFSYEVYSSINTTLSFYMEAEDKCSDPVNFYLHLDTFYDCRGIFNKDLNKCKNSIIRNNTNCSSQEESIINYNILENWIFYDERAIFCSKYYYSKFTQKVDKLKGKSICKKGELLSYEYLLQNTDSSCPDYKICGYLDTKGNILCLDRCPYNSIYYSSSSYSENIEIGNSKYIHFENYHTTQPLLVTFIISENYPLSHEWDKIVKETSEELDEKDFEKRRQLTNKDFLLLDMGDDTTYKIVNKNNDVYLIVSDLKNRIKDYYNKGYNDNQILNIYYRNYIGFKNIEELFKFKKIFNNKDDTDNPLYKLSSSGHNPLITIILSAFFFVVSIAYLIIVLKKIFNDYISLILFYAFIVISIIFWLGEFITMAVHFGKYPRIYIDMDDRMQKVLDLYNKRTVICQIFRIISIIFKSISLIFGVIYYWKQLRTNYQNALQ